MSKKLAVDITGFEPAEAKELINYVLIEYLTTTDDDTEKRQDIALLFAYLSDAIG